VNPPLSTASPGWVTTTIPNNNIGFINVELPQCLTISDNDKTYLIERNGSEIIIKEATPEGYKELHRMDSMELVKIILQNGFNSISEEIKKICG
jgi:hypothetical protein